MPFTKRLLSGSTATNRESSPMPAIMPTISMRFLSSPVFWISALAAGQARPMIIVRKRTNRMSLNVSSLRFVG